MINLINLLKLQILSNTPSVSKQKLRLDIILRFKTKDTFGEISLKLRQMNWNVARNNVNVVASELPSQSTNNLHLFNNWYLTQPKPEHQRGLMCVICQWR
jgi:hypothetical protein